MNKENHIVKDSDVRPARPDGTCFYCSAKLNSEHNVGCVIRSRTVMVEVTFLLLKRIPEDWDTHMVEFHMNESSSCCNNLVRDVSAQVVRMDETSEDLGNGVKQGVCMCNYTTGKFIREATQEDEDTFGTPA